MLRYAITSRALNPGNEQEKQAALLRRASRWVADGIDLIQLREKDLPAGAIAALAGKILKTISLETATTKLVINSRCDIAIATRAHGVHLTSEANQRTPTQVRRLYASAKLHRPIITISCHTLDEGRRAREDQVDAILFAPVFEKELSDNQIIRGQGLDRLHAICSAASPVPVFALGGVTLENASACVAAGAAGIAGIRLFHSS